jgi:hypothetical protein
MYSIKRKITGAIRNTSDWLGTIFTVALLVWIAAPAWGAINQWTPHGPYGGSITSLAANKLSSALTQGVPPVEFSRAPMAA